MATARKAAVENGTSPNGEAAISQAAAVAEGGIVDEALEAAGAVVDKVEVRRPKEVTLSSGVRLLVKPVTPYLIQEAMARIPRPVVPKVMLEEKGREEENPDDPQYAEALEEYNRKTQEVGANVMLGAGTSLLSVPEDMVGPEDDSWLELLEFVGVPAEFTGPRYRYLAWLKYYALMSVSDLQLASGAVASLTGVSEEEVASAVESFRPRTRRRATNHVSTKAS